MSFLEGKLPSTLPETEIYGSKIQWNEVSINKDSANFLFTIRNFSHLNKENGEYIESSRFSMEKNKDLKWFLRLHPKGETKEDEDFLSLFLCSSFEIPREIKANYFIAILDKSKNKNYAMEGSDNFEQIDSWGQSRFIAISELLKNQDSLLPDDTLSIFCSITAFVDFETNLKTIETLKSMEKQQKRESNIYKNITNIYENCYLDDCFSDVTITIDGNKLKAHKVFLAAASPVFASILKKDKKTNSITVSGISYEIMKELLHFIYTKKIDDLHNIAHELIAAAAKYGIQDLKAECEESLCRNINIDNVLKLIVIADENDAKILKKLTIQFITKNKQALKNNPDFELVFESRPQLYKLLFWADLKSPK